MTPERLLAAKAVHPFACNARHVGLTTREGIGRCAGCSWGGEGQGGVCSASS